MFFTETCLDLAESGLLQENYNFNNLSNPARRSSDISIHLSPAAKQNLYGISSRCAVFSEIG